jgi:hypothetical protein
VHLAQEIFEWLVRLTGFVHRVAVSRLWSAAGPYALISMVRTSPATSPGAAGRCQ